MRNRRVLNHFEDYVIFLYRLDGEEYRRVWFKGCEKKLLVVIVNFNTKAFGMKIAVLLPRILVSIVIMVL